MHDNAEKYKHPTGLYLLFFTEMWERFSYYGMRALLVLYMIQQLAFSVEKAGNIYGLYTGFVYLTPLFGGYIADRFLGQRRCITLGAALMCIGLFSLASGINFLFLPALFIMIIANGFFKSNISSTLGLLYGDNNTQKDSAFTIFYMGINLGAFFSPLVCATVAVKYGFQAGFASAGIGMLIGMIIYKLFENKLLGECGLNPIKKILSENISNKTNSANIDKSRIAALFILMLFTIIFWMCYEQAGCSLTLFAQDATNKTVFNHNIPAGYFQSLNPLFIMILAPLASNLWTFLNKKRCEPTSVEKFTIALGIMGIAYLFMSVAGKLSETATVSCLWLIGVYFIMTVAELCISPIGLSLVSKLAPKQFVSVFMGGWFLTSFFGNILAGFWGGKYETLTPCNLFFILAVISLVSSLLLFFIIPKLNKLLKEN